MASVETRTSLIVNFLPPELSDEEFRSIFLSLGPLKSSKVVRDKATAMSYGFGFVEYETEVDAKRAVKTFDCLQLQNKKIKVSHANVNDDANNNNVYIKNLPKEYTDKDLSEMCRDFGRIIQSTVLVDLQTGVSRCIGFVLYETQEQADKAIDSLNGKTLSGASQPLLAKYADDPAKKGMKQAVTTKIPQVQYPTGPAAPNMFQNALMSPNNDGFNMSQNFQNSRQMGPMRSTSMNRFRFNPMATNNDAQPVANMGNNAGGDHIHLPKGPPYAIFVLNIGTDAEDRELWALFSPFGAVSKVAVTFTSNKQSKGYGFVEMPNLQEAKFAIEKLNGLWYKGKQLSVSFKK